MMLRAMIGGLLTSILMLESAFALSCARPNLAETMERAKASDTLFYILVGRFRLQNPYVKSDYPSYDENNIGPKRAMMWFDGQGLAAHPWQDTRLSHFPVEVQTSCAGPWCSSPPQSRDPQIAFVEVRPGQAPLLKVSPCPEWVFRVEPQSDQIQDLRDCLDKPCKAAQRPTPY